MKKGDMVLVDYVGRLETGEIFDLTYEDLAKKEGIYNKNARYKPIPILLGAGFVIKGFEKALYEMKPGEKKEVKILPEDGFGKRQPGLVKVFPRKMFKDIKQGMVVEIDGKRGRVQSVTSGRVMIDFNNPLAGKNLVYEIEIKKEIKEPTEKIKYVLWFFGIEQAEIKINEQVEIKARVPDFLKQKIATIIKQHIENKKVVYIEEY